MANEYGNYSTFNPLWNDGGVTTATYSNGNLTTVVPNGYAAAATIAVSSGKWYWEVEFDAGTYTKFGWTNENGTSVPGGAGGVTNFWWINSGGSRVYSEGDYVTTGTTYANGDIIGFAVDFTNDAVWVSKNGTWMGSATEAEIEAGTTTNALWEDELVGQTIRPVVCCDGATNSTNIINFGQTAFQTAPPDGFLTLNTANLPTPVIINPAEHFHSVVVAHDGSSTASTCTFNLSTYEWLAIIKNTTGADENWYWINSIRGVNKYTSSNTSASEVTDANVLTVSGTTFTLGSTLGAKNYLVEIHKAGLASATASNEAGSINTTETSFNQLSGFVISEFEGTAGNATIGNPLDEALDFLIHRPLDISGIANNAVVYHSSLSSGTQFITMGQAGDGVTIVAARETGAPQQTDATMWNSTAPTSSLISLGSNVRSNAGSSMMSYGWHRVSGYSDYGSYVGNYNADGPFVNTGSFFGSFLTRHITDSSFTQSSGWAIMDKNLGTGVEPGFNYNYSNIYWSIPGIASTAGSNGSLQYEFISNGMKIRRANSASGAVWMYCSWGGRPMTSGGINQGRAK